MTIETFRPTSDYSVGFTPYPSSPNYGNVDEAVLNTGDYNYRTFTGEGSASDVFGFGTPLIPGNAANIKVKVYMNEYVSGPNLDASVLIVVGSNTYNQIADIYEWTQNPKTSAPWTVDDINGVGSNALQYIGYNGNKYTGVGSITMTVYQLYMEISYDLIPPSVWLF